MERTVKALQGDDILATDGAIGSVRDVFFDDERWGVRYFVVDTGNWMPGKRVLISPASVAGEGPYADTLRVDLTREQVKSAPPAEADRPVSRRYEQAHAAHFGYAPYWTGPLLWGAAAHPMDPLATRGAQRPEPAPAPQRCAEEELAQADSHLRSGAEVIGYGIEAADGEIGNVEDFVLDERTWAIRSVVVDTTKWWPGGQVRVSPSDVADIDWNARKMRLRLTRAQLKAAPAA